MKEKTAVHKGKTKMKVMMFNITKPTENQMIKYALNEMEAKAVLLSVSNCLLE